ncbi:MAG: single-stranded DNA-binding protein [Patescibacteria group bacterium]
MASSLNRVTLIGNLTRDPELRKTTGGQSVASFTIATNRAYTSSDGQKKDQADYHSLVAWGRLGEICAQYLVKGKKIYVDGRLQTREWDGQDGQKRYRTEVVIENMIMLDRSGQVSGAPKSLDAADAAAEAAAAPIMTDEPSQAPNEEIKLEDIPF